MNIKELGEIRRRMRRDRSNMTAIYGCYVNSQKEIIALFTQSVAMMPENEAEKYFTVLKRALSGTIGKNLIDISFQTKQVADSPEHKLLMDLRNGGLQKEDTRLAFFRKIIDSVSFDDNYVILIGCDRYDVPFKSKDDRTQNDASEEVYTYLLCAVCPVKLKKPGLQYIAQDKEFHDSGTVQEICAPEVGFLFPAFDNRATNIYNALLYSHSPKVSQQGFSDAIFNVGLPMPAEEQRKSFEALLARSLTDECSLRVVQTVHEQICQQIEIHKESKVAEPLLISKEEVKTALKACGVSEPGVARFSVNFDETFGNEAELHPRNIIDNRSFEIHTPDISIKVKPESSDLIETRVIGGVKYIMICADADVEVNGVSIHIDDEQTVNA